MHILERGKGKIRVQRRNKIWFYGGSSFVPVCSLGHFATTYLNPMDAGSILDFYYLHFFCYNVIKIKAVGLIYIPAQAKFGTGRRLCKSIGVRD